MRGCKGSEVHPPRSFSAASAFPSHSHPRPHSLSQTGQHCPGILPGCLQGTGGQGRGSHWTLPFCQQGLVRGSRQARKPGPPTRQPHSQRSGTASRGPRSPLALRCGAPAHLGNSLQRRGAQTAQGPLPASLLACVGDPSWASHQLLSPSGPSSRSTHRLTITHRAAGAWEGPGRVWA